MAKDGDETTLLDDVKGAYEQLSGEDDAAVNDAKPGKIEEGVAKLSDDSGDARPQGDRERDEKGRFKPQEEGQKPRETLTLKKPLEQKAPPQGQQQNAPQALQPPKSWKGEGKIRWEKLPREIQSELIDRWNGTETAQQELAPLKELIEANRADLVNAAGSVPEAFRQLVGFHRMYLTNPLGLANLILRSAGIDPRAAYGQPQQQGQPQQASSDISKLLDQAVAAYLQPFEAERERRENQQVIDSVESFRSDGKHPYFEDVRHYMGHLVRSGAAKDLQDAYDQAVWANPTIRAALIQRQGEEAKAKAAQEAQRARQASRASVRGAPVAGTLNGAGNSKSSVLDDVREAHAELQGR